jgi:hypothetical protein
VSNSLLSKLCGIFILISFVINDLAQVLVQNNQLHEKEDEMLCVWEKFQVKYKSLFEIEKEMIVNLSKFQLVCGHERLNSNQIR